MSNVKKFLTLKFIWKGSYRILTLFMVLFALFLFVMEVRFTNAQTEDELYIMENHSAGKPNKELVEVVYRLEQQDVKETMATTIEKKQEKSIVKKKSSVKNKISQKEYNILVRIVEAETTGGDIKSKQIVANVILNRVAHKGFPNTIEEVVFQRNGNVVQFSPISDGRYYSVHVTKQTKKAVDKALNGEDNSKGALYFANRTYSNPKNMEWFDKNLEYLFSYGGHEYFTEK